MDYLRSLGTVLVNKSGLNLPFSLGPTVSSLDGICTLYDGTKRDDGSPVSVFEYDFSQKKNLEPLAKNALRKLRTTRHPDVLKYIDAVESDSTIFIMTERVRPLQAVLDSWSLKGSKEREDWLLWGLHRVSVALAFLNDPCASTHGNVRTTSVFISPSGEWKLGGLEVLSNPSDDAAVLYNLGGLLPNAMTWAAPEVKKNGWSSLKQGDPSAADAYSLGLLINAVFNPTNHPPPTAHPPHPPPTAASRGEIPTAIFPLVKNLLNPSNKARWSPKRFLDAGMADSGFFSSNRLVQVCSALDNFTLGSESEKNALLRNLNESADSFPPEFAMHRILPSLLKALEFGGASAATMLPLVIKFGKNVSSDEYQNTLVAPLVKLFASPDRGTRMALLDQLPEYVEKLDKKTVDKIFPHLQTGFSDTVALIREATVKSVILLAPKFSDRVLNNDLLRHLAKMQTDPEASIRTNTCILIGRLGPTLGYNTKKKVLVPAFTRAIKDTFVHARVAGLMAFMATIDCFDAEDLATKVIPNLSSAMIDKEKLVRDQAFKAMDLFIKKLESHAATMPETAISDVNDKLAAITGAAPQDGTLANSAAGAAGALAGWAISSIGKRLAATDMQSAIGGATIDRPTSAPPPEDSRIGNLRPSPLLTSVSAANSTVTTPAVPGFSIKPASRGKGLQLGAHKSSSAVSAALIDQLTEEVAAENDNPWGGDDLMDVNADEDDWSAFEVAPVPVVQPKPTPAFLNGGSTLSSHQTKSPPMARSRSPLVATAVHSQTSSSADQWDSDAASPPTPSAPLTKEERAAEMARRKEERKQRIAMLKEQKKTAAKKS
ncbi:armadillo-type protein [Mucidula mucida]|nr:armadillo-type protein [Mucidula mucida]